MTETTVQGASHLTGDAQRATITFRDVDAFHFIAIAKIEEPFVGSVFGCQITRNPRTGDHEPFGQPRLQRLGDIRHLGKIAYTAAVDPLENLVGPEARFAHLGQDREYIITIHADQIDRGVGIRNGSGKYLRVYGHRASHSRAAPERQQRT